MKTNVIECNRKTFSKLVKVSLKSLTIGEQVISSSDNKIFDRNCCSEVWAPGHVADF
jgi:hypothetical protein